VGCWFCDLPADGVSGPLPKLQAGIQHKELQPHRPSWFLRRGLGDERHAPLDNRYHLPLQRSSYPLEDEVAEDDISVDSRGGVLHRINAMMAAADIIYLRLLLRGMRFLPEGYTPVFEDNNACIAWSNNIIGGRGRAKHIDIRKHFAHAAFRMVISSLFDSRPRISSPTSSPRVYALMPRASPASSENHGPRIVTDIGTHEGKLWICPKRANRATSTLTRGVS
jgi:hypothetical protein